MPEDITELSFNSSRADTSYSRFQPASAHRTWRRFISATVMTASFSVTESVTTQECHLVLTSMGSLEGGLRCSDGRWWIILTPRPIHAHSAPSEEVRQGRWGRLEAFTRTSPRQAVVGGSLLCTLLPST